MRERADLYHFHDPELLWVGVLLKLRGFRVIYDVHEDVPKQIMSKPWIPRWARPIISKAVHLVEQLGARIVDRDRRGDTYHRAQVPSGEDRRRAELPGGIVCGGRRRGPAAR